METVQNNTEKLEKSLHSVKNSVYSWCFQCQRWIPKSQMYGAGEEWFHQCESTKENLRNGQ